MTFKALRGLEQIWIAQVDALGDDDHPGSTLVRVRGGEAVLLARLTKRAANAPSVKPSADLWVQVKSVALLE